jgi:hypothetical protein
MQYYAHLLIAPHTNTVLLVCRAVNTAGSSHTSTACMHGQGCSLKRQPQRSPLPALLRSHLQLLRQQRNRQPPAVRQAQLPALPPTSHATQKNRLQPHLQLLRQQRDRQPPAVRQTELPALPPTSNPPTTPPQHTQSSPVTAQAAV